MPRAAILPALLFFTVTAAFPQAKGTAFPAPPITLAPILSYVAGPDSLPAPPARDTAATPREGKNSWTAVGLSAVLPGAGQVYTENYWKVPVILGLGGYWVYEWSRNNDSYQQYHDLYEQSVVESPPNGDERYLQLREAYKDQRDSFAWYLGILYLVNIVDAYVGAELYEFDVGPDLGVRGGGAYATLRIRL